MKLLRNKQFQDFLLLPRGSRDPFRRALESADDVSSTETIRSGNEEYKIEDYLDIFARYVRENATEIQAMQILLKKPQSWSPQALNELKETLLKSPVMFNIEHLQRAHKQRYNKALVDIISMVKHAAKEESPLLTAEERVEQPVRGDITKQQQLTLRFGERIGFARRRGSGLDKAARAHFHHA